MRNRLLSSNSGPGEVLRSCQDAGVGDAGIADVSDSARGSATGFSSHPLSYDKGEFPAGAVNRLFPATSTLGSSRDQLTQVPQVHPSVWPFHRGVGLATYRPVRASSRSLLTFFATFPVLTRASSSESESPIQRFRAAFQSCRRYRLPLPSPQRRE